MATALKTIESARNDEYRCLSNEEIEREIYKCMHARQIPGTIIEVDETVPVRCSQLFIEYHLNRNELSMARDFAEDVLDMMEAA